MDKVVADMKTAADSMKGCGIEHAMDDLAFADHLQYIHELEKQSGGNTKLKFDYKKDQPTDYDFSIYASGPSDSSLDDIAKTLGMNPSELKELADSARKNMGPQLLLHESFSYDPANNKFSVDVKCHGD